MSLVEQVSGSNAIYLKIVKGSFRQDVPEGTPGAKAREWEANGSSGVKHEITYKNLTGVISEISTEEITFKDGKGMQVLRVKIENDGEVAVFTTETKSKFAIDFMKKLPNLKPGEVVVINPYDFEDKQGKRRTAFNLIQNDQKIYSYYWDNEKGKPVNGIPSVSQEDAAEYDSDDWKTHFIKEKKFLVKATQKLAPKFITVNSAETVSSDEEEVDDKLPF